VAVALRFFFCIYLTQFIHIKSLFPFLLARIFDVRGVREGVAQQRASLSGDGDDASAADSFQTDRTAQHSKLIGSISGMDRGVFAVDFSDKGNMVAIAGGDASVRIVGVTEKGGDESNGGGEKS
jgi:hypothetical protein